MKRLQHFNKNYEPMAAEGEILVLLWQVADVVDCYLNVPSEG